MAKLNAYVLVDRSGSMASNWEETIGAVNGYVETLANTKGMKGSPVTVAVFDSGGFDILRQSVKAKDWNTISPSEVTPRSMTPLFDSIGKLSALVDGDKPKAASITILTDGAENASREVSKAGAKTIIDGFKDKNFDVVFIGADFDAFGEAGNVGVSKGSTINTSAGNYGDTTQLLAARTVAYAASGSIGAFSDEDRKRAAGVK